MPAAEWIRVSYLSRSRSSSWIDPGLGIGVRRFEGRGCRAKGFKFRVRESRADNTGELTGSGFRFRIAGIEMLASESLRAGAYCVFKFCWLGSSLAYLSRCSARDMANLPKLGFAS